jgi:hypothetical protein
VRKLAKKGIEFFGQDNQWAFTSLGAEYDYAYNFMTDEERALVRRLSLLPPQVNAQPVWRSQGTSSSTIT